MPTLPTFHFAGLNYLAVLASAVMAMALGWIYYSKAMFGKLSAEFSGHAKEPVKFKTYIAAFICELVTAYVIALFINTFSYFPTWSDGVIFGFVVWLGFAGTASLGGVLWEKKPFQLYLLKNTYSLLKLILMGMILAAWR